MLIIRPEGAFSLEAATGVMGNWMPVRRFLPSAGDPILRLGLLSDGDYQPYAAAVTQRGETLTVELEGPVEWARARAQLERLLSLDGEGRALEAIGARDPKLGALLTRLPGLRPVLFPSPYEAAAWGVLSQRIRMTQAEQLQARLIDALGTRVTVGGVALRTFPRPEALLRAPELPGLDAERRLRLRAVAEAALDGRLDVDHLRALGREGALAQLRSIRGIGDFWSRGVWLRACGIDDEFADEPRAVAALGRLHGVGEEPDRATIDRLTEAYRPLRMWICFLLRVAEARGLV